MSVIENSTAASSSGRRAGAPASNGRDKSGWKRFRLTNAAVRLCPQYLSQVEARALFDLIHGKARWQQDRVHLFGRTHLIPRLHQWYADPGLCYRWSGLNMQPEPWFDELKALRDRIAGAVGVPFNSVLVNLYRDGRDSMGWHADDEPELGRQPVIASLSLGAARDLVLRCKEQHDARPRQTITLNDGSLLVMAGNTQQFWQHSLPKRRRIKAARINLTFRRILYAGSA